MTVVYFGLGASQLLLNLWEPSSFALFGVCSLLMSLSLVPVALTRTPAPPLPSPQFFGIRRLYEISPLGVAGSVASGVVLGAFYGLGPVFAAGAGLDVAGTARFMTATILGGLVLQWPLGWLSDRFDRRTVISGVCAAIALFGAAMVAGKALSEPVLLAGAVPVYSGAIFSLSPLCIAHANDYITSDDRVGASGGLMLAYGVGAVAGPLLASAAVMGLGTGGLFALGAAVGLATLLFAFWRMARRTAPRSTGRVPAPAAHQPLRRRAWRGTGRPRHAHRRNPAPRRRGRRHLLKPCRKCRSGSGFQRAEI